MASTVLNLLSLKYLYLIIIFFSIYSPATITANTLFNNGETLFLNDKPHEARPLLEQSLQVEQPKEIIYLYLSIIYEQLTDYNKAIEVIQDGLNHTSELKDELYFNLGNNYYQISDFTSAIDSYTNAIKLNPNNVSAYLNRANSNLQMQALEPALADYILYLQLLPTSKQKDNIEKIIEILQKRITIQKEQQQKEQERQQELLNSVLNSLQNASKNTKNIAAGSAEVEEHYEELDIED